MRSRSQIGVLESLRVGGGKLTDAVKEGGKRGKAEITLARLVAATGEEIAESGSFSAERVASRAGTSVATFYIHLPTKDAALTAAFDGVLDEMIAMVGRELRIERLLEDGLGTLAENFVRASLDFFSTRSLIFRCALARLPQSRSLREVYRSHESECFECYRHFIELGQAAGKIRGGESETLSRALLVLSQGFNNPQLLELPSTDPLVRELVGMVSGLLESRKL